MVTLSRLTKKIACLTLLLLLSSFSTTQLLFDPSKAASGDGGSADEESLAVEPLVIQDDSVEEYISRSKGDVEVPKRSPENPWESRRLWEMKTENDSDYLAVMELIWVQYLEDLNYSSYLLDEFVEGNISGREAMTATMSLFTLTSQTVDTVDLITPPTKYEEYHENTLQALVNLEGYLWNMAKFYETNRRVYAMQAHENFNASMYYYENGTKAAKGVLTVPP